MEMRGKKSNEELEKEGYLKWGKHSNVSRPKSRQPEAKE